VQKKSDPSVSSLLRRDDKLFGKIGFLTVVQKKKSDPSVSSLLRRDDKLFGKIGFLTAVQKKKSDFFKKSDF
jgi:hypothetical protein